MKVLYTVVIFRAQRRLAKPWATCSNWGKVDHGKTLWKVLQVRIQCCQLFYDHGTPSWQHCQFLVIAYLLWYVLFLGTREMSVAPILRFFEPLKVWLEKKNQENGDVPGWTTMDSKDEE